MGLVLTLKPQERIILGGAVVRNNGAYSTQLMIETHTPILRCPDILPESKTNSPCSRIYMAIELLYIQPEQREETMKLYLALTSEVLAAASSTAPLLEEVSRLVIAGEYYKALQKMKRLLRYEKSLLNASRLPPGRHGTHPEVRKSV
jgi:flagellar protein FlbT